MVFSNSCAFQPFHRTLQIPRRENVGRLLSVQTPIENLKPRPWLVVSSYYYISVCTSSRVRFNIRQ